MRGRYKTFRIGPMVVVQPNSVEASSMSECPSRKGPNTLAPPVSLPPLLLVLAAILILGPRSAEAQSPDAIPRQGIPITQQGTLSESGGPLLSDDGWTAKSHREAVAVRDGIQIERETTLPDPRWVPSAHWPVRDDGLPTNEGEHTAAEGPKASPQ
jgi:hypothetical protein